MQIKKLIRKFTKFRKKAIIPFALGILVVAIPVFLLLSKNKTEVQASWYSEEWRFRKLIATDPADVSGSSDFTNFPILVSGTDSDLIYKAQDDGDDILFTDANGNKIDHELSYFNNSTGTLNAWVRLPTLSTSVPTVFYMYYGNVNAPNQENPSGVWENGYQMVHHFEETSGQHYDSTVNNNDSSTVSVTAQGYYSNNVLGGFDYFNGTSNRVLIPDTTTADIGSSQGHTLSTWIYLETNTSATKNIISKGPSAAIFMDLSSSENVEFGINGLNGTCTSASTIATGGWHYLVGVYDNAGDDYYVYIDGALNATCTNASGTPVDDDYDYDIGTYDNGSIYTDFFPGAIDELRLSSTNKSSDWIATEYANQSDPTGFSSSNGIEEKYNQGPIVYLPFDEGNGTIAHDNFSSASNATIGGGATWNTTELCIKGSCLLYDGIDNSAVITNNSAVDLNKYNAREGTITTWIKVASDGENNTGQIFSKGTNTYIRVSNEGADGYVNLDASIDLATTDATVSVTDAFKLNRWYHVALVYADDSDDEIQIYIDGQLRATSSNGSGAPAADTANLSIGGDASNNFDGYIDEFKIYDFAKTADEIKTEASPDSSKSGSTAIFSKDAAKVTNNGLIGYWNMDEYSAGSAAITRSDSSGNGNHFTDASPYAASTAGKYGRGVNFVQANSEYLTLADANSKGLNTQDQLTLSLWLNPSTQTSSGIILAKDSTNGNLSFNITRYYDERITFDFSENGFYYAGGSIWADTGITTLNVWQMLTITYDGEYFRLYMNGEELTSGEFPYHYPGATIYDTTSPLTVGGGQTNGGTAYYNGAIDEVRIYNRALSPSEIENLYKLAPAPYAYFPFDEMKGTFAYNKGTNMTHAEFADSPANPTWVRGKFGGGLYSDGVDDTLDASHATNWDYYTTDNLTWEVWIKLTGSTGSSGGYLLGDEGGPLMFLDRATDNTYQICWYTTGQSCGSVLTYEFNRWYHIALVKEGTSRVVTYRDGIVAGTDTSISEGNENEATLELLSGTSAWKLKGSIDEVRMYNYARTPSQIISDMNAGHPTPGSPVGSAAAWYKFDEGYGDIAYNSGSAGTVINGDLGGSSQTCPASGTVPCPSVEPNGKFDKALSFDGTDDSIVIAGNNALEPQSLTVSGWLKTSAVTNTAMPGVIGNYDLADNGYALAMGSTTICPDKLVAYISAGYPDNLCSTTSVNDGEWHHFVMTYEDGEGEKLYIDGKLEATDATVTGTVYYVNSTMYIGSLANLEGFYFNGALDEIKIYSAAHTADQVITEYNQGKANKIGSASTEADGTGSDANARLYCPPGNSEGNCAAGQDPSPIARFDFDGKNTSSLFDVSGNANTGTIGGSITTAQFTPGVFGSALTFDGTNDYVAADTVMDILDASEATFSLWFKTTYSGAAAPEIFSINTSSCGNNLLVYIDSDGTIVTNSINGNFGGTAVVNDGKWHHLAITYSDTGNSLYAYVDGKYDFNFSATFSLDNGDYFSIGQEYDSTPSCPTASNFFPGSIDEVRVYPYVRTKAQLQWDYVKDAPFHWYKFDECQGSTLYDSGNNKENGTIAVGDTSGDNDSTGTCASASTTEMWGEGAVGKIEASLGFDGTNDVVTLGDMSILENATQATWAFWVKPSNVTLADCIVCKLDLSPSTNNAWAITSGGATASLLSMAIATTATDTGTGAYVNSGPLQNDLWIHVVVVFDGTGATNADRLKIYINGKQEALTYAGTIPGTLLASAIPVTVGAGNDAGITNFAGQIDDLRIYNYPISQQQIENIYNLGAALRFE